MLVLMMRRRNNTLLLAAGFCVSFLLGTLVNVLYIPAFEPGVRGGPGVRFYGGRLSEEEAWKSASPPDRPEPGAAARLAELRLQIQARYDEVLRYRSSSTDNRPYQDRSIDNRPYRDRSIDNRPYRDRSIDNRPYRDRSIDNRPGSDKRPDQDWDSTDDDNLLLLLLPQERQRRLMDLRDRHHRRNPRFYHPSPPAEYPSSEPSNNRTVGGGGRGGGRTEGGAGGTRFETESVSVRLSPERHQRRRRVNPGDRDAFSHALTGTPATQLTPLTDCGGLDVDLTAARYLGSGYTKAVHRAVAMMPTVNGTAAVPVALKSVERGGHDMQNCVRRFGSGSEAACHRLASLKIIKETSLMERLQHPNVLRLHGVCYQSNGALGQTVTAVTELGTPLDMITLLQSPWETRFKMCMGLVRLLHHLAHSPVGSVALLDFRPRQFVLVGAELKVSDLDDATADTPLCYPQSPAAACRLEFPARNFSLPCTGGRCEAINEKRNLYNAYRFFFTYLLPHSAPPGLRPLLDNIVNATSELVWGVDQTLEQMDRVLHSYTNGLYLDNHTHTAAYRPLPGQAIQGDDYRCWPSYRHDACQLSVISLREAGLICDSHAHCRAFVLTNERTWTGRQLVYFKMGGARLSPAQRWTSYIRVGS